MQLNPEQIALLDSTTVDQYTMEQLLVLVKDKFGAASARAIMKDVSGQTMMMALMPEHFEGFIDACKKLIKDDFGNQDQSVGDDPPVKPKPKPGRNSIRAAIARNTETVQTNTIKARISIEDIEKLLIDQFDLPPNIQFDWCYSESQQELLHLEIEHVEQVKL